MHWNTLLRCTHVIAGRLRLVLLAALNTGCVVAALYMLCPADGLAQDAELVGGLAKGARDTMRLDVRTKGRQEQVVDARISDQKIGSEERRVRLEKRAEELLRAEEGARQEQESFRSEEEARAEARRGERQRLEEKKKRVTVSPSL